MPFTPVNFLHAPKQESVYGDLLKNAMEGYELARKPKQIAQEEQQREFANRLLQEQGTGAQHENYAKSLRNEYLPDELENKQKTSDIELEFLRPTKESELERKRADLAATLLSNEEQQMKNSIQKKFGLSNAEIDQLYKKAQTHKLQQEAKYSHLSHLTPTQKDALATYGSLTSPESREYQRRALGVMPSPTDDEGNTLPLPPNAIKLQGFGEGVKKGYTDKMDKNIERGEAAKIANGYLDEIENIINKYPRAYKELSYILAHPEDTGRVARLIDATRDEELKTALDLMQKYSSSLVIAQTETSNQRATNAFRTLVSQTKPNSGMTPAAIKNVIRNMRKANDPLANYADEAAPFSGYAYIPYQAKNFQSEVDDLSNSLNSAEDKSEMVTIRNSKTGETKTVSREEAKKMGAIK